MTGRVILVPGLWLPSVSMAWHAGQLREAGFAPELFDYSAVAGGPDAAVAALRERLQEPADIIAHSLGGLVSMRTLEQCPELPVKRLVCMGSPLCGSSAATGLARNRLTAAAMGRSAELLRQGCKPWRGKTQVGMIAGNVAFGLGWFFSDHGGDSDGTVAVAETCLPGLADQVLVPASHSGLLMSSDAARQAIWFLGHGTFIH